LKVHVLVYSPAQASYLRRLQYGCAGEKFNADLASLWLSQQFAMDVAQVNHDLGGFPWLHGGEEHLEPK
jgi:hypothetical protein